MCFHNIYLLFLPVCLRVKFSKSIITVREADLSKEKKIVDFHCRMCVSRPNLSLFLGKRRPFNWIVRFSSEKVTLRIKIMEIVEVSSNFFYNNTDKTWKSFRICSCEAKNLRNLPIFRILHFFIFNCSCFSCLCLSSFCVVFSCFCFLVFVFFFSFFVFLVFFFLKKNFFPNSVSLRVLQEVKRVHTLCPQVGTAPAGIGQNLPATCRQAHITAKALWILTLTHRAPLSRNQ